MDLVEQANVLGLSVEFCCIKCGAVYYGILQHITLFDVGENRNIFCSRVA